MSRSCVALASSVLVATPVWAACPRPTSPEGYGGHAYGAHAVEVASGPRTLVHYTLDGPDAVASADVALAVRDVAEEALTAYEALGFPRPPSDVLAGCEGDGDPRYDLYLIDFTAGDGQTVGEACEPGRLANCSSFARVARDLDRRYPSLHVGAKTVVTHELFHAVQYAITTELPPFWSEGTAQFYAEHTHPELTDFESFLPTYFAEPERPLDSQGASAVGAWQYATAIWPRFVASRYGDEVVRDAILAAADADATDALGGVLERAGSSLRDAFAEFGCWNAATGARDVGTGYVDAASYPAVPSTSFTSDEASDVMTGLSTRYFELVRQEAGRLRLTSGAVDRLTVSVLPVEDAGIDLSKRLVVPDAGLDLAAGAFVVVVSSVSPSKRDNPFTVRWASQPAAKAPDPGSAQNAESGGCSIQGSPTTMSPTSAFSLFVIGLALVACRRETKPAPAAPDQKRVVSVGSANSETVFALGRGADVIAVDTSSLFPEAATKLPQVGYQRSLSAEGILSVHPTLVLVPTEGGPPAVLDQLRAAGIRVETIDVPPTEQGTLARIEKIASLLGVDGGPLGQQVRSDLAAAQAEAAKTTTVPKVLVLYARGPGTVQAFGEGTAADRLLGLAHARNAAQGFTGSKPISAEAVVAWAPDVIVLPARGQESLGGVKGVLEQPGLRETPAGKTGRVVAVDDLLLLGLGPRLGAAVTALSKAVHVAP